MKFCYYTNGNVTVEVPRSILKPAEILLAESGQDWRPIRAEHVRGGRKSCLALRLYLQQLAACHRDDAN